MKDIYVFLKELKQNNNREWFQENRQRYLRTKFFYDDFIQKMIFEISKFDADVSHVMARECIFRIYRDIRFTHDKTPFKTHLGAFIVKGGKKNPRGGYYIHIEPGNSLLAGGIWCPTPKLLKDLRQDIYENAEEFLQIIEEPELKRLYVYDEEKLTNVPSPFPSDSPVAEWLKNKRFTLATYVPDDFFLSDNAIKNTVSMLKLLYPFNRFLNHTVDEDAK
jgi:uncharacterized protein (TIGR02453 family)